MDLDAVTELAGLALDLNTVMEVLFESGTVEDTVAGRARVVDNELVLSSSVLSSSGLGLEQTDETNNKYHDQPTEKRTQQSCSGS